MRTDSRSFGQDYMTSLRAFSSKVSSNYFFVTVLVFINEETLGYRFLFTLLVVLFDSLDCCSRCDYCTVLLGVERSTTNDSCTVLP